MEGIHRKDQEALDSSPSFEEENNLQGHRAQRSQEVAGGADECTTTRLETDDGIRYLTTTSIPKHSGRSPSRIEPVKLEYHTRPTVQQQLMGTMVLHFKETSSRAPVITPYLAQC